MVFKKWVAACTLAVASLLFFAGPLAAQMNPIYRFKKVAIPFDLRVDDSVLPKGEYDLEFVRAPNMKAYYMRIMKKGKILHLVQGEEYAYDDSRTAPIKPTLNMNKNSAKRSLTIVFESGIHARVYPKLRARYRVEYVED